MRFIKFSSPRILQRGKGLVDYQGRERQGWGPLWLLHQRRKLHSAVSEIVSLLKYSWTKNGFTDPKSFRGFPGFLFFIIARRRQNLLDVRLKICAVECVLLYPGIPGWLWRHVEISIDFEQYSRSARNQGHDKRGEIIIYLWKYSWRSWMV